jgi:EXLDI family protein
MPNKTIYVSGSDLPLYERAQELAGGNLSAAIAAALRRYVDAEEARSEGFEEITLQVGPGAGRKVRFIGVLLGEWGRSTKTLVEVFRVYRGRNGKFAVHIERSPEYAWKGGSDADGSSTGWRRYFSSNQTWGSSIGVSTLEVFDSVEALRAAIPPELWDMVAASAEQVPVEELDI